MALTRHAPTRSETRNFLKTHRCAMSPVGRHARFIRKQVFGAYGRGLTNNTTRKNLEAIHSKELKHETA